MLETRQSTKATFVSEESALLDHRAVRIHSSPSADTTGAGDIIKGFSERIRKVKRCEPYHAQYSEKKRAEESTRLKMERVRRVEIATLCLASDTDYSDFLKRANKDLNSITFLEIHRSA